MRKPAKSFAVRVAFDWHGGQSSALYSFASTGGVVHNEEHALRLRLEVEKSLLWAQQWINDRMARGESAKEYLKEPHRLMRLRTFISDAPIKGDQK